MKHLLLWIVIFIINQITTTIPLIIFLLIYPTGNISAFISLIFCYNLAFSSFSYLFTIVFKIKSHYDSIFPCVYLSLYNLSLLIFIISNDYPNIHLSNFLFYIFPSIYYTFDNQTSLNNQIIIFCITFIIYSYILYILEYIIFKFYNRKK